MIEAFVSKMDKAAYKIRLLKEIAEKKEHNHILLRCRNTNVVKLHEIVNNMGYRPLSVEDKVLYVQDTHNVRVEIREVDYYV